MTEDPPTALEILEIQKKVGSDKQGCKGPFPRGGGADRELCSTRQLKIPILHSQHKKKHSRVRGSGPVPGKEDRSHFSKIDPGLLLAVFQPCDRCVYFQPVRRQLVSPLERF